MTGQHCQTWQNMQSYVHMLRGNLHPCAMCPSIFLEIKSSNSEHRHCPDSIILQTFPNSQFGSFVGSFQPSRVAPGGGRLRPGRTGAVGGALWGSGLFLGGAAEAREDVSGVAGFKKIFSTGGISHAFQPISPVPRPRTTWPSPSTRPPRYWRPPATRRRCWAGRRARRTRRNALQLQGGGIWGMRINTVNGHSSYMLPFLP